MNLLWRLLKVAALALLGISIALSVKAWVMWNDAGQIAHTSISAGQPATTGQTTGLTETEALVSMMLYGTTQETARHARQALATRAVSGKTQLHALERHALARFTALHLSQQASDEACIKAYLGTAYFGNEDYGLSAAKQSLFPDISGKIDIQEAATLAALVRAPDLRNDEDALRKQVEELKTHLQDRTS